MQQKVQSCGELSSTEQTTHEAPELVDLTRAMTKGGEIAWRAFYDVYFGRLWRYLLVVTAGQEDAAREALQATLIRVARHIKVFDDENVFWSWLALLARNSIADENKKRRRYLAFLDRFAQQARVQSQPAAPEQAEERLDTLLQRHLALLPAEERELIQWKYFDHRSVRDIAGALQTTEKAVESKLSRVRQKLKDAALSELKHESEG